MSAITYRNAYWLSEDLKKQVYRQIIQHAEYSHLSYDQFLDIFTTMKPWTAEEDDPEGEYRRAEERAERKRQRREEVELVITPDEIRQRIEEEKFVIAPEEIVERREPFESKPIEDITPKPYKGTHAKMLPIPILFYALLKLRKKVIKQYIHDKIHPWI